MINEGDRPSLLQLGRYATGELDAAARRELEAELALDGDSARLLSEMEQARAQMPPLDLVSLRARAAALPAEATVAAQANNNWGFLGLRGLLPVLAVAAALLLALLLVLQPEDKPDLRYRMGDALQIYHLGPQGGVPYEVGTAMGENDMLGFTVSGEGHQGVVVLSVDGNGTVSVFYPKSGDAPEPLSGGGLVKLPGSVILDGAPGPEIFLAVFDETVSEAREQVLHTYQSGGPESLLEWAEGAPSVDAVPVTRR